MQRKKLGIITGSSPNSGIDLWQEILKENRAFLKDSYRGAKDAPELVILSIPELEESMELGKNYTSVRQILEKTIKDITLHVDFFCVTCSTLNVFQDDIRAMGYDDIFISATDALLEYLKGENIKDIAILGNKPLLQLDKLSAYRSFPRHFNVEVPENLDQMQEVVIGLKKDGINSKSTNEKFAKIINNLKSKHVILACSELMVEDASKFDKIFINTNTILAKKMVLKSFY